MSTTRRRSCDRQRCRSAGSSALHSSDSSRIGKEANPPGVSGTATGVVNFLNFTFSALLGPVFGWLLTAVSGGASPMTLEHYQTAFQPLLYGVGLAIVLTLFLKETGSAAAARLKPSHYDVKGEIARA